MYLQISPIFGYWGVRLGLAGVVVGSAITFGSTTLAQVVPDNTLGGENSVVTSTDSVDTITGGATRGGNLFHSFDSFSIPTGRATLFDNGASIQNILTRVTGGSVTNIDGLLAANGAANLFLLNPNGIVFGQNAQLLIGGSFIATTASRIDFADGTQFSATPGTGAPLLTVNVPIGLQFGSAPGAIVNRAGDVVSLQVQPGKTLGLIGGNISWEGSQLVAPGGRVELGAVAAPGVVGLSIDNNLRFNFPTELALADVSLTNRAFIYLGGGGGGSIAVNARNLVLTEGSQLASGIDANQGAVGAVAGDIEINAQGAVVIDGADQQDFSSGLFSSVSQGGIGKAGDINIRTSSLFLTNGGAIFASTAGRGDAGNVNISASDAISFDGVGSNGRYSGIYNNVLSSGIGNGGSVNITTRSLSLTKGSFITANTFGQGNAGNVNISASDAISFDGVASDGFSAGVFSNVREGSRGNGGDINLRAERLSLTNGAQLSANTLGQGGAGNISVQASGFISLSNSNIFSNVDAGGTGNGGTIDIKADSLSLVNGSQIIAAVGDGFNSLPGGRGNGGKINIDVSDSFSASGSDGNGLSSGVFTSVGSGAVGKSGDIDIKARSLSLTNGAQLSSSTFGQGDAGNIYIVISDSIAFDGVGSNGFSTGVFSNVEAGGLGNGGNINLLARNISLTNGAQLSANTSGRGDAGNISVQTDSFITLSNSYIFASVESGGLGNGGDINIEANSLSLTDGAQILSLIRGTSNELPGGRGNAGDVNIAVRDSFTANGVSTDGFFSGVFSSLGSGIEGRGGEIYIRAGRLSLEEGGRLNSSSEGQGNGGDINIEANLLSLKNGGQLNSNSEGQGNAGSIDVEVLRSLDIDNGSISAQSISGNGGNIRLRAGQRVALRNGSQITTSAGTEQQPGNEGNLVIDSPLVIANFNGNNDIITNAFPGGSGGGITINAQNVIGFSPLSRQTVLSLFGTNPTSTEVLNFLNSSPSNDVASLSNFQFNFDSGEVFSASDLIELPTVPVDASTLVAAGCPSGAENRFVVAGRGGLPPAPGDKLSTDALLTDWATLTTPETSNRAAAKQTIPEAANTTIAPLVEATTWQFGSKGEIILTNADPTTPNSFEATPTSCPSS